MRNWMICIGLATILLLPGEASATSDAIEGLFTGDLQDLYGDEEFVSIATGSSKPIYKAPAVASVITAKEIEAMGATTLNEVLERVPGLHVSLSTLSRLDSVYSIRGIHTGFNPHVLFLMNGIPVQELWTGAHPILFRLPVAAISRIEVIRGPGSAIYGADAFAGVINIISKDLADIGGTVLGARRGSFDTTDIWLQHGGTYAGWDLAFSFEWQKSDGDRDRRISRDSQTFWDELTAATVPDPPLPASLAPGPLATHYEVFDTHLNARRGDIQLRLWNWRLEDAGVGAGAAQALDPEGSQSDNLYLGDLTWQSSQLVPNWDLSARLSYQYLDNDIRFVVFPPGANLPIGEDGNINLTSPNRVTFPAGVIATPSGTSETSGIELTGLSSGFLDHRLRLGTGYKYHTFETSESKNFGPGVINGTEETVGGTLTDVTDTNFVYAPDKTRHLWYLSLQDEWQVAPDWELTSGIRYDRYSDFGDTVNPRLALVWATRYNLTSKILYGRAFRAPSFSELYAINNPSVQGNPDLKPETIDTIELSFDYRPTFDLQTILTLFAYRAEDLIDFVPDDRLNPSRKTAQNARDQEGYGLEMEVLWQATDNLLVGGNYAWQHSQDADSRQRIPDAPSQQLLLMADWRFRPNWYFHPQINWVGSRKRAAGDSRSEIDDYALVDLTLRHKEIFNHLNLALAVRNIFDENAREPSDGTIPGDYPLEGRSFWVELSWRM